MHHPERTQPLRHSQGSMGGTGWGKKRQLLEEGVVLWCRQISYKSAKLFITEQREAVSFLL